MARKTLLVIVLVVLAAGMLAGCTKQFTRQRYETIRIGLSEFDVEKTLGEPTAKFSDTWTYINDEPFYKAIIKFENGSVIDKAWADMNEIESHPDMKDEIGDPSITVETRTVVE